MNKSLYSTRPKLRNSLNLIPLIMLIAGMACALAGCKKDSATSETTAAASVTASVDSTTIVSGTAEGSTVTGTNADDLIENSTFTSIVAIAMGTTATITNPLAASGVTITQSNGDVVINATASNVEYALSGTTSSGSVKIYSEKKFKLTLNGVSITNNDGPAINIQSSKRAFIVLADGTTNTLTDAATYATSAEDQKGTLFSEGQMVFSGNGTLNVTGNNKHAIASDDYVRVRSGNITITGAKTDGIHTNDSFIADGGTVKITASSDGIEAEEGYVIINNGTFTINAVDDGIAASYEGTDATITPYVTINNGSITVNTTTGEGIEAKSVLTINKGNVLATTADDGLNAGTALYINGGNVYAYSSGNDAMDSNGTFTITGGKVVAIGSKSPEASIDCDARTFKVTGGIVVGIAGATSAPTASVTTVRALVMGSGNAQLIHIEAADGKEALTFMAPAAYSTLLFASSKLKASTTYTVYTDGSVAGGTNFKGLYTSGTYTSGTKGTSFTTSSVLTQTGGSISKN